MLKMDRGDDGNAMAQHRVRDLKRFALEQVEEVHDPAGMARDLLKGLLYKGLRHGAAEIAEPHREEEGVVQQARDGGVDELPEQPGPPVPALLVQLSGLAVLEVILVPAVFQWHPTVDVKVPRHDLRVVRLGFPWRRGVRVCWAGGVGACHLPDFGELVSEVQDVIFGIVSAP